VVEERGGDFNNLKDGFVIKWNVHQRQKIDLSLEERWCITNVSKGPS